MFDFKSALQIWNKNNDVFSISICIWYLHVGASFYNEVHTTIAQPKTRGSWVLVRYKSLSQNCLIGTRLKDVGEYASSHFAFDHSPVEKPIWILWLPDRNHSFFQRSKNSCEDYRMGLQPNWGNLWSNKHEQSKYQSSTKATNSKHFLLQCHQQTGLLDVGYTVKIDEEEMVVYRRNLTVGIGCSCKTRTVQRVVQPERIYHL